MSVNMISCTLNDRFHINNNGNTFIIKITHENCTNERNRTLLIIIIVNKMMFSNKPIISTNLGEYGTTPI